MEIWGTPFTKPAISAAGAWIDGLAEPLVAEGLRGVGGTLWRRLPVLGILYPSDLGDGTLPESIFWRGVDQFDFKYEWGRGAFEMPPFAQMSVDRWSFRAPTADPSPVKLGGGLYGVRSSFGYAIGRAPEMDDLPNGASEMVMRPPLAGRFSERYEANARHQAAVAELAQRQAEQAAKTQALLDHMSVSRSAISAQIEWQRREVADLYARRDAAFASAQSSLKDGLARQKAEGVAKANAQEIARAEARLSALQAEMDSIGQWVPDIARPQEVVNFWDTAAGQKLAGLLRVRATNRGLELSAAFNVRLLRSETARDANRDRLASRPPRNDRKSGGRGLLAAYRLISRTWGPLSELWEVGAAFQSALYVQEDDGSRSYLFGDAYTARERLRFAERVQRQEALDEAPGLERVGWKLRSFNEGLAGYLEGELKVDFAMFAKSLAWNAVEDRLYASASRGLDRQLVGSGRLVGYSFGPAF